MMNDISFPLDIFYDASCPVCKAEMEAIKISDVGNKINLIDCSDITFNDNPYAKDGVYQVDMMECIHAQDAKGKWIKGVDVFAVAYKVTGFDLIGKFWGNNAIRPITTKLYPWIARNRQFLSKTGLPFLFNSIVRKMAETKAEKSFKNSRACANGSCKTE